MMIGLENNGFLLSILLILVSMKYFSLASAGERVNESTSQLAPVKVGGGKRLKSD
jgi:hypothetical protein